MREFSLFTRGEPAGSDTHARARTVVTAIETKVHPDPMGMSKTDPKAWALESYAQRQFVYSPPAAASQNPDGTIQHHQSPDHRGEADRLCWASAGEGVEWDLWDAGMRNETQFYA